MIIGQLKQNLGLCYKAAGGSSWNPRKWSRASARDELKGWNAPVHFIPLSLQIGFQASVIHKVACNMHFPPYPLLLRLQNIYRPTKRSGWVPNSWARDLDWPDLVRCSPQAQAAVTDGGELEVQTWLPEYAAPWKGWRSLLERGRAGWHPSSVKPQPFCLSRHPIQAVDFLQTVFPLQLEPSKVDEFDHKNFEKYNSSCSLEKGSPKGLMRHFSWVLLENVK